MWILRQLAWPVQISALARAAKGMTTALFAGYSPRPQGQEKSGSQLPTKSPISHMARTLFPEFQDDSYTMLNFRQNFYTFSKFYVLQILKTIFLLLHYITTAFYIINFPLIILQLLDPNSIWVYSYLDLETKPKVLPHCGWPWSIEFNPQMLW